MTAAKNTPISRTVTILNGLVVAFVFSLVFKEYSQQKSLVSMTGNHLGIATFVYNNAHQLVWQGLIVAMLLFGLTLEWRRSRVAWIANVGMPLLALALLAAQMIEHWDPETAGEAEQLLFLIAVPLATVCVLYSAIYYRRRRHSLNSE